MPQDFKDVATQLIAEIDKQFDRGLVAYASNGTFGRSLDSTGRFIEPVHIARSVEEAMAT